MVEANDDALETIEKSASLHVGLDQKWIVHDPWVLSIGLLAGAD